MPELIHSYQNIMMGNKLFSVLIANYNNGCYLKEAIDSVLNQTYHDWEIIIVDDCSTDNSKDIYREYSSDSRFHIYYNDCNKGCGYTKRRCVDEAHGEICGFLDPDDVLLPDALEKMVKVHEEHPEVSIVYSRCYRCDTDMNVYGENELLDLKKGESFYTYRWYGAMHFATFKKSYYDKTEGISSYIQAGVDQDLYFKMEEVGDIYVLNEFTYKYRQGVSTAVTSNWFRVWFWNLEVRRNACVRRGLNLSDETYNDFIKVIEERENRIINQNKHDILFSSKVFRLGYILLFPFIKLQKVLNRFRQITKK